MRSVNLRSGPKGSDQIHSLSIEGGKAAAKVLSKKKSRLKNLGLSTDESKTLMENQNERNTG